MTIAEHRAKCIKAMSIAWLRSRGYKTPETMVPDWMMRQTIEEQTAAFDSLHGIARVNLIEATEEMQQVGMDAAHLEGGDFKTIFDAMSAAGDLTSPPEQKP